MRRIGRQQPGLLVLLSEVSEGLSKGSKKSLESEIEDLLSFYQRPDDLVAEDPPTNLI